MRKAFGERNPSWEISMAIPASYWYLQHFDVSALEPEVSWFNLMRYGRLSLVAALWDWIISY